MKSSPISNDSSLILVDDEDYERMAQYVWRRKLRKPRPPYYVYCHINRELFLFHTALLGKAPRGFVWDHINCDVLDNRRSNLRIATYTINAINKSVERQ